MNQVKCSQARPTEMDDYDHALKDMPADVWGWVWGENTLVVTLGECKVLALGLGVWWEFAEEKRFCPARAGQLGTVRFGR